MGRRVIGFGGERGSRDFRGEGIHSKGVKVKDEGGLSVDIVLGHLVDVERVLAILEHTVYLIPDLLEYLGI